MTLEELQERYPHGSRWRHDSEWLGKREHRQYRVVGYDGDGIVCANCGPDNKGGYTLFSPAGLDSIERLPDPVPCPTTEPVTLDHWPGWVPGDRPLTVHPPDAENPRGWLSWEGGPAA